MTSKYNPDFLRGQMMYDRLGCDKNADEQSIKRAYRKMAMKYHPDKAGDDIALATECFKLINEANSILSDNVKRMKYDTWLSRGANEAFDPNETDLIPWIPGDGWDAKIGNIFVFGMILCILPISLAPYLYMTMSARIPALVENMGNLCMFPGASKISPGRYVLAIVGCHVAGIAWLDYHPIGIYYRHILGGIATWIMVGSYRGRCDPDPDCDSIHWWDTTLCSSLVSSALSGLFQRLFDTEEDMHKFSEQVHKRSGSVVFWLAGLLGVWKYQRHWIVRSLAFCLVALVTVGQLVNTEKNQGDKKKAVHMGYQLAIIAVHDFCWGASGFLWTGVRLGFYVYSNNIVASHDAWGTATLAFNVWVTLPYLWSTITGLWW
eukprot:m.1122852 g.1122852  ORF g.1122852 m.1122852 type:complete len:377 (+) comp24403_c0_seq26:464-1594(+)